MSQLTANGSSEAVLELGRKLADFRTIYVALPGADGLPELLDLFQASAAGKLTADACIIPAGGPETLGDPTFAHDYGIRYAYKTGAMANGIASEELVIAIGAAGLLGSFGAAGLVPTRVAQAVRRIKAELPGKPFAFNLIHSPAEEALEREAVNIFLAEGVKTIEASAFLDLTPHIVRYRAAGLSEDANGNLVIANRVIAKVSRREVAEKFMKPAPQRILDKLLAEGSITAKQAELAAKIPVADDITAEADSGGHTDNRSLVCLLPSLIALRDQIRAEYNYPVPLRVGAAGGIGTPEAAAAAFAAGAAYVVTGSVNQACLESGTSDHVRKLLAAAEEADVMPAPAADMFEAGVKVQVLKRGTMFGMRGLKLYELYRNYDSWEAIPADERERTEKQILRNTFDEVWAQTASYFNGRDPEQIRRAEENPKRKMALVFRWYLGLSSSWANRGEKGRELDYQIWCGPAMGSFNARVKGTKLEKPENRKAADVAEFIMKGAAYCCRVNALRAGGFRVPSEITAYQPE